MDMTKKNPVNRSGADEILFNDFYNRQSNKHLEYENNSSGRKNESREIPIWTNMKIMNDEFILVFISKIDEMKVLTNQQT